MRHGSILVGTTILAFSVIATGAMAGNTITVGNATYGRNCTTNAVNATAKVSAKCDGKASCLYPVDVSDLGDPAYGCQKEFVVTWTCSANPGNLQSVTVPKEATGGTANLFCQ